MISDDGSIASRSVGAHHHSDPRLPGLHNMDMRCVNNCGTTLTGRQRSYCSDTCQSEYARRKRLDSIFSITPEEYDAILAEQGGGCGICGRPPTDGKRHAVDHDHKSGLIRGLLCFMCNKRVLGARSADVLIRTAAYVQDPPAKRVIGDRVAPGRPKKKRKRTSAPARRRTTKITADRSNSVSASARRNSVR